MSVNSTNINKINNYLSPQIFEHKKRRHMIWHWKSKSNGNTDINEQQQKPTQIRST